MGKKQVLLNEDVRAKLEAKKRDGESVSDVIDRLISDWSLAEWGGWMDEAEAKAHRDMLDELSAVE
jgi:predicted CopG family antitoxin